MYASNGGSPASSNISIVDINTMSNRQFHNPALKEFLRQLQDPVPNSGNNNAGAGKNQEAQQNNSQNNNNSHDQFKMIVTSLLVQMDDMSARLHDIKEIQRDLSIKQINMENMLLKFMKNGGSGSTSNANSNGCNFSNSSMNSSEKDESNSTKSGDRKLNEHENGSSDSNNVQITSGNSNEVEGPTSGSNRSNVSSDNTNNSKNSSKRSSRSDEEVGKKEKKHEKQGNKNNKEQQILKKEDKERLQKIQDELLEKNSQTSKSLNPLPLSDDDAENNNNKTEKPANRIEDDRRSKAASSIAEQFLAQQVNKCSNVLKIAEDQEDLMVDTIKSDNEPKTVVEVDLHKKTEKLTVKNSNNKPQLDLKQIAVNKANLIENLNNLRKKTENLSASQNTIQAILMGRQQAQAQNAAHLQAQANSIQVQAVKQAQAAANVIQNQQNLMAIHQQQQQQLNQTQRLLQLNTQSSEHNKSGNEEINIETIPENENNVSTTAAEELLRPALKRKMVQPQTNNLPLNNSLLLQLAQSQNNNNAKNSSNLNQPPKIIQQTVNQNNVLNQTNNLGNLNIQNNSLNLSNFQNIINKQRHESASAALCGASSAASNISNSTNLQNNNPTTATAAAAGLGANKLNAPLPLTININSNGTNNIEVNNNIPSSRSNIEWLAGQNGQVSAPIAGTGQFNFQAPLHRSESLRSLNSMLLGFLVALYFDIVSMLLVSFEPTKKPLPIDLTHNSPALTPQLSSTSQTPLISNLPSLLHNNNRNLILQNTSSGLTSPYHNLSGSHSSLNGISLNNSLHNVSSHSLHHSHSHSHHHSHHDEITNQATLNNEQFCNVKRHMTLIQKLVTEHAKTHGPGCKFVKNFALCKSIWELNRLSKKNPHVSLMKKMLQEMPEKEWPTPQVKGFVEGSIKKSEMPNTQIFLLRIGVLRCLENFEKRNNQFYIRTKLKTFFPRRSPNAILHLLQIRSLPMPKLHRRPRPRTLQRRIHKNHGYLLRHQKPSAPNPSQAPKKTRKRDHAS